MHDQQAPASKPVFLTPRPQSKYPPKSPVALQGASSAFLPKEPIPTLSISTASTGARLAAFAAGTQAQQRTREPSPTRQNGQTEPLPSARGRQLQSSPNLPLGAAKSTTSPAVTSGLTIPALQTRSSSTLAAQHASTISRSPHRSPSRSPHSSGTSTTPTKESERLTQSPDALSGATISMAASLARGQTQADPQSTIKSRIMNWERLPSLPSSSSNVALTGDTDYVTANVPSAQRRAPGNILSPSQGGNATSILSRDYDPIRSREERTGLLRQWSEESAATTATTPSSASTFSVMTDPTRVGRPPLIPRDSNFKYLQTRTPLSGKAKTADEYRSTMTVNSLADAMVASSLASSRAASPAKKAPAPPPPASRRRSRSIPALYEKTLGTEMQHVKTAPKIPRPMKQTLRKQASSEDEEAGLTKRGRRHWMRRHPNMHSEGDRKRWRDKVTERERRRYEGVFAANRGILIGSGVFEPSADALSSNTAIGNQVVNVVVQDIWERSRLPREVLREIYDLVSPEEDLSLNREQFVVGLWLIDQRLKGRKLPIKVSPSVWSSVRHSEGIKIKHRQI